MQVDAVEQRAADFVEVLVDGSGVAGAFDGGVVVVAAGAGVHCRHEHKGCGIFGGHLGAADGDAALLHRLSQHFEHAAFEFGQLVEEEHAVVGQADFAGLRIGTAAHEGDVRYGVVRGAEGSHGNQRVFFAHLACHAVDLGCFEGFFEAEWRQDGWQPLGKHRLAAARRADENHVVATGGGNLEGALDFFLPLDVGKVELVLVQVAGKLGARVDDCGLDGFGAVEVVDDLDDVFGTVDFEVVDDGSLAGVVAWQYDALVFAAACLDGHRQGPFDGAQAAVERHLAHNDVVAQPFGTHLAVGGEDTDGQGQVVGGALLAYVGRGHIDDHAALRDVVAAMHQG